MYCTLSISLFSNFLLSSYLTAVVRTEQGLEIGDERISKITESSFTQICPLIIRLLLNRLYEERGGVVVSEGEQHVGCIRGEESNVMSPNPPTPSTPLFYSKQLDRSAAIGCTSSTWAALPFLAVPNGAANSMLLAGWQTGRWEPANGRLDEDQAPVNCTMASPTNTGLACQLSPSIWND